VQIALGSCFIKGQERGRFEGKHGERRPQRISYREVRFAWAVSWDGSKTPSNQAKERIGGEMLASFRGNKCHGKPHHEDIQWFR
jgi:hypothetical protein